MRQLIVPTMLLAAACQGKPDEDFAIAPDDKADSFHSPVRMGGLVAEAQRRASLGEGETFHAYFFWVAEEADVVIETAPGSEGDPLDTVLYLYARGDESWGRYLAKNDDGGDFADGGFSRIERRLEPGRYRVIVKGHATSDLGEYGIVARGFSTPCVFGEQFADLDEESAVEVTSRKAITAADIPSLNDTDKAQIVRSLKASSHDDVRTVEEAFERVDGGEINRITMTDQTGVRSFRGWEYGAGDNSFGAIFPRTGTTPAAEIHDGFFEACKVPAQQCLFGSMYDNVNDAGLLEAMSEDTYTAESKLSASEERQIIEAVNNEFTTAAEAIEATDDDSIDAVELVDDRNGTAYRYYRFYSGDTAVGAVFRGDDATPVATMGDGQINTCEVYF